MARGVAAAGRAGDRTLLAAALAAVLWSRGINPTRTSLMGIFVLNLLLPVILGGIAGNAIAKDTCRDKNHDAYYYNNTYYDAFNDPDEGDEYEWRNPYTNNYGYVSAGDYYEDGYQGYSGPCREFEQRVYIDGHPETATGVACRQGDGTWRIVSGQ